MIRKKETGENGTLLPEQTMPRRKLRRLLSTIIFLLILVYLLIAYEEIPLPTLAHSPNFPEKTKYDEQPTYEYVSYYRQEADHAFEAALDEKLRALEQETIKTLLTDQLEVMNLSIWQITTQEGADALPVWTAQWKDNNPDWRYNLFTSPPLELYSHFQGIPEIAGLNSTSTTVQNDLLRYLLLWFHGGFYAEIDTWNRVALRQCPPIAAVLAKQKKVSLMVGIDTDEPFLSDSMLREWKWARGVAFGQAIMWAPLRFDPILRKAIVRTVSHARMHATFAEETWTEKITTRIDYTGEISGNGMFTDVILELLSSTLKEDNEVRDREAGLERRVTWKKFRALKEVVWMDVEQVKEGSEGDMRGLAILPINIWGNGKSHSNSGSFEHPEACINYLPGFRPR